MAGQYRHSDTATGAGSDGDTTNYLDTPQEQLRHPVIASLVEIHGRGEVIDLGCAAGHLLRWLHPRFVTRYLGVDISADALSRIGAAAFPIEKHCCSVDDFVPPARPIGTLVFSEVLQLVDDPAATLARIAGSLPSLDAVIVSRVSGRPDKPNWAKGALIIDRAIETAGWARLERVRIEAGSSNTTWEITVHKPIIRAG